MPRANDLVVPFGSRGADIPVKAQTSAVGVVPVLVAIPITSQTAGNFDFTAPYKLRVLDAWAVHEGGAGEASDTLQVFNGANAISDAMDWSGVDTAIVRAAQINDAYRDVAKAGTLRVTTVDADVGTDVGLGTVYVLCAKVP